MGNFVKILFLASMGFLHLRRADSVYPGDKIMLTMKDGCTYNAKLSVVWRPPEWLKPDRMNEPPPRSMDFYIKSVFIQYEGSFNRPPIVVKHKPANHTLRSLMIHMNLILFSEHYIIDGTFEVYTPEHHGSWFPEPTPSQPAKGYIYLSMPGGSKYRAPLKPQSFQKDEKRISNLAPVIFRKKVPKTSLPDPHDEASSSGAASTS